MADICSNIPAGDSMAIYAYADETIFTFSESANKMAIGCGILISNTPIQQQIIDEAMENLAKDPDFDRKLDQATIDKGFFHASDDSKNGHSHLCTVIKKYVHSIFDFTYETNISGKDLRQSKFTENILIRCLGSSAVEFFNSPEEVFLTIEKRDEFTQRSASDWLDAIYKEYEESTYGAPFLKTYFPKITIELLGKSSPGLQVTDFLLWSIGRSKKEKPHDDWLKRLKFESWHYHENKTNHFKVTYYLDILQSLKQTEKYPYKFQKAETSAELINAFRLIERTLVNLSPDDFPLHAKHLYNDFESVSARLKDIRYHLKNTDLEWTGRVFLRLFDTIPLYQNVKLEDNDAWNALFHAKSLASMLVRKDQIHFNRVQNAIAGWRYEIQTERPEELRQLHSL